MPSYTEPMIIEKLEEAMKRPETLYQEDFINYRGRTKDSQKRYSEIIAEKLLKELEIFKEIKSITRETSYEITWWANIKSRFKPERRTDSSFNA